MNTKVKKKSVFRVTGLKNLGRVGTHFLKNIYSKTCLKRPLKKKTKHWFSRQTIA